MNLKASRLLNKSIKNSSLFIIPNSGHEINIDNPKKLQKL